MKQETNAITTAISTNPTTMDSAVNLRERKRKREQHISGEKTSKQVTLYIVKTQEQQNYLTVTPRHSYTFTFLWIFTSR